MCVAGVYAVCQLIRTEVLESAETVANGTNVIMLQSVLLDR